MKIEKDFLAGHSLMSLAVSAEVRYLQLPFSVQVLDHFVL